MVKVSLLFFCWWQITDIEPDQCITYRIEAINHGIVPLTDIIIKDTLQKIGLNNAFAISTLAGPTPIGENNNTPTFPSNSVTIGMVVTNKLNLGTTSSDRRKAIRFNTKYGTIDGN